MAENKQGQQEHQERSKPGRGGASPGKEPHREQHREVEHNGDERTQQTMPHEEVGRRDNETSHREKKEEPSQRNMSREEVGRREEITRNKH